MLNSFQAYSANTLSWAYSLSEKGNHKRAEREMLLMLDVADPKSPNNASVLLGLGRVYERMRRYDLAVVCCTLSKEIRPDKRANEIIDAISKSFGIVNSPDQLIAFMERRQRVITFGSSLGQSPITSSKLVVNREP